MVEVFRKVAQVLHGVQTSNEDLKLAIAVKTCVVAYLAARGDCGVVVSAVWRDLETLQRMADSRNVDVEIVDEFNHIIERVKLTKMAEAEDSCDSVSAGLGFNRRLID